MKYMTGLSTAGLSVWLVSALVGCQPNDAPPNPAGDPTAATDTEIEVAAPNEQARDQTGDRCAGVELATDRDPSEVNLRLSGAISSLSFNDALLADFGVKVTDAEAAVATATQHSLSTHPHTITSFASSASCLYLGLQEGHFIEFVGGSISHRGGPTLSAEATNSKDVSMSGFNLVPVGKEQELTVTSATGEVLFHGTMPHHETDPESGLFHLFNIDLQVSEDLAARWQRPDMAGLVVGMLSVRGMIEGWDPVALAMAAPACGDWSGDVDVAMVGMSTVQQTFRGSGRVVITPSARLKNNGTANVPWYSKFSGTFEPYGNDQHPFLVWDLYREHNGVFEQLAHSQIKHGFLTINSNCKPDACRDSHILGLGCEDVYGVGTNLTPLGPRDEISPHAGVWAHCNEPVPNTPSYFDREAPFCFQDHSGSDESVFKHRLSVRESELALADAKYYFTSWYVVRDDVEPYNNMAWREITPAFNNNAWTFNFASGFNNGSVLDAWVNPSNPGPGNASGRVTVEGAGNVHTAVQTTDLGRGFTKYVYSLRSHDFDPEINSFTVPLAAGVQVLGPRFYDMDGRSSTDWTVEITPGESVTWTAPSEIANLPWGTMYSFSFIATAAPVAGEVGFTRSDTGTQIPVASLGVGTGQLPAQ